MAVLDFSGFSSGIFSMRNPNYVDYVSPASSSSTEFAWNTTLGSIVAHGSGITTDGSGNPTGGTITSLELNISAGSITVPITGLSADLTDLVSAAETFWETVCDGATDFGTVSTSATLLGDFDIFDTGAVTAGIDTITGDKTGLTFVGDAYTVMTSLAVLTGGADTISGTMGTVYGDAYEVLLGATLFGGADAITPFTNTTIASYANFYGDAKYVENASVNGGADLLDLTGWNSSYAAYIYGDVQNVTSIGGSLTYLNGGDDTIYAAATSTYIAGDAWDLTGSGVIAYGGDDIISCVSAINPGLYGDTVYGDAITIDTGAILYGGDDTITGSGEGDVLLGDVSIVSGTLHAGDDTIYGGGGNDSIWGDYRTAYVTVYGTGMDEIYGGDGDDTIHGNFGDDLLYGENDDDTIDGGDGDDLIDGGAGNDTASYTSAVTGAGVTVSLALNGVAQNTIAAGVDTLVDIENLTGTYYADTLTGSSGDNTIDGNQGNDLIIASAGTDILNGGVDSSVTYVDTVSFANAAASVVINGFTDTGGADGVTALAVSGASQSSLANFEIYLLGAFGDTFDASGLGATAPVQAKGFAGDDMLTGGGGDDTLAGGAGFDTLNGGTGADLLYGGANADTLNGNAGFDILYGGDGKDTLNGGDQADTLYGENGDDILNGGAGADTLNGGLQNDSLFGDDGADVLNGNAGFDDLHGGTGNDTLSGGANADELFGDEDNDTLYGGGGVDTLYGGTQEDSLFGEAGNDALYGDAGFDILNGGDGNDTLTGGAQADTFVFEDGFGADTITDFAATNNAEKIDLSAVTSIVDWLDLSTPANGHMYQSGADVIINDLAGNTIALTGVNIGDLDAADFIF